MRSSRGRARQDCDLVSVALVRLLFRQPVVVLGVEHLHGGGFELVRLAQFDPRKSRSVRCRGRRPTLVEGVLHTVLEHSVGLTPCCVEDLLSDFFLKFKREG